MKRLKNILRYPLARAYSWIWHLSYGMWKGYYITATFEMVEEYGWKVRGPIKTLTSADTNFKTIKVFWTREV